ncbi:hypothetical protein BRM3_09000 [Brachybacterium huguangmaarense]|uniref:Uncharacterized protein n=1 Tax=Brachybacterium huguangmaarense TaxID=1652028 RepID=A0ABY6FY46_9MICO|nr:hypothetical protein [Brachybacterium huguangmaarense]UYG15782.1 hypothetical protein BRM3_09000 [Brachybacterium huguangmaarense]
MTTMYIPTLIESAAQAEALPVGTIALDGPDEPEAFENGAAVKVAPDVADGIPWLINAMSTGSNADMIGWTALVPIETDEEHGRHAEGLGGMRRLVTPWEPVA